MNLNELAVKVAKEETGKKEVSIGQIKEIIKIMTIEMSKDEKLVKKLVNHGRRKRKQVEIKHE